MGFLLLAALFVILPLDPYLFYVANGELIIVAACLDLDTL